MSDEYYEEHYLDMITQDELPHLKNILEKTMELLPEDQKIILTKTFWENQSVREVAAQLDFGKSVVHKKMKFAFENLASLILGLASSDPKLKRPQRSKMKGF